MVYFVIGHSIMDWLRFEWYRFKWWTGDRPWSWWLIGQMLFTGSFNAWWSDQPLRVADHDWNIWWPLTFFAGCLGSVFLPFWKKPWMENIKQYLDVTVVFIFAFGMLALYVIGSAAYGRYLILLLPFWFILACVGGMRWWTNRSKQLTID